MHHRNHLLAAVLLLAIGTVAACGGGNDDYSKYSGTWTIETIQTGGSHPTLRCSLDSIVSATVSPGGQATFGPISNSCDTMLRGSFSGNSLTLTSNNDAWNNNGNICCTGTITLAMTFTGENLGTGTAMLNNCPGQDSQWCTLQVTMRR